MNEICFQNAFNYFVYNTHKVYIDSETCSQLFKVVNCIFEVKHSECKYCEWNNVYVQILFNYFVYNIHNV